MSRPVTAKVVAQRAGVHQTTVSLALRSSPKISPEVSARICRIAKDMGYYPRAAGQFLRKHRTGQIGVIVATQSAATAFSEGIVGHVIDACVAKGIHYTIDFHPPEQPGSPFVPPYSAAAGLNDGVLLVGEVGQSLRDWLNKHAKHPWVSLLEPATYWVQAAVDQGTAKAVQMLYESGHRRLAHAAGPQLYNEHRLRHEAFVAAARRLNLDLPEGWAFAFDAPHGLRSRLTWAKGLLEGLVRPTAVICPGASEARVLIAEARSRGLRVPEDLSVVAWTDEQSAQFEAPVLTVMGRDGPRIAQVGVEMLLRLIEGQEVSPRFQSIPVLSFPGHSVAPCHDRPLS